MMDGTENSMRLPPTKTGEPHEGSPTGEDASALQTPADREYRWRVLPFAAYRNGAPAGDQVISPRTAVPPGTGDQEVPVAPLKVPHEPPVQVTPEEHAVPHAPQLVELVRMFTSHPSEATPLQSAKPVLHEATRHAPDTHAGTPLATEQVVPQAPQLVTVVAVLTSQPSAATPLQSAKPGVHAKPHTPAPHVRAALGTDGHARPHAMQLSGSVLRLTQLPEQSVSPAPQVTTQVREEHTCPEGQIVPQAPQLLLSLARSRHTPEQLACPVGHTSVQALDTQLCPAGHAVVHVPQWLRSLVRSKHAVPHALRPAVQLVTQADPEHTWPEGHTVPHAPQLFRSLVRLTHDEPQAVWPAGHEMVQVPPRHT